MEPNITVTPRQFLRDFGTVCAAALGVGLAVAAVAGLVVVLIRSGAA